MNSKSSLDFSQHLGGRFLVLDAHSDEVKSPPTSVREGWESNDYGNQLLFFFPTFFSDS